MESCAEDPRLTEEKTFLLSKSAFCLVFWSGYFLTLLQCFFHCVIIFTTFHTQSFFQVALAYDQFHEANPNGEISKEKYLEEKAVRKESCVNNCILLFIGKDKSDIRKLYFTFLCFTYNLQRQEWQLYFTYLYRTSCWQSPCSKSLMKTTVEHSTFTNSCCRVFHSSCLYFCLFFVSSDIGSLYRLFSSLGMS